MVYNKNDELLFFVIEFKKLGIKLTNVNHSYDI